jgi:hypothetical protein
MKKKPRCRCDQADCTFVRSCSKAIPHKHKKGCPDSETPCYQGEAPNRTGDEAPKSFPIIRYRRCIPV